jgi:colanic acid biosynthesis glycosyl transferase WcaI
MGQTMRKKILLLTQFFPPEAGAGAKRIGSMADVLSKHYEVLVVALKPSYPSTQEYKALSLKAHDAGYPYVVKRTFNFHPHKGSLLLRTLREQLMAIRLALQALPESADIVVTSSPSMFLGPVGLVVAKAKDARFVWDVRDVTWGYARDVVGSSRAMVFATRLLEKYILYALRRADLVVGVSPGITRVLVAGGVESGRTITVPNGISTDLLDAIVKRTATKVENQRPLITYAGAIGYAQGLSVLLEAARMLADIDFVLAGDGPELPLLKKKARELRLSNVSFRGYLDREGLLELYRQSDVMIAHLRSSPTIDATALPTKLFEYMATGKPIVYAGRGAATELLGQIGCAVTVSPEDPKAISTAIAKLLRNPAQMQALGLKGRSHVQAVLHRDKLMEELAYALKERFCREPDAR